MGGKCISRTDLLDVVVGEGAAILELLASKDQALLVGGDALLVLDLGLDIVDRVRGLDLEGDGLAREGLDEAARWCPASVTLRGCVRHRPPSAQRSISSSLSLRGIEETYICTARSRLLAYRASPRSPTWEIRYLLLPDSATVMPWRWVCSCQEIGGPQAVTRCLGWWG